MHYLAVSFSNFLALPKFTELPIGYIKGYTLFVYMTISPLKLWQQYLASKQIIPW